METVTLNTKCGRCIGRVCEDGYIFSGVPYATAERFEMPVAVTDFGGTFDATKKPIEFPQLNTYTDDSRRFYTREFRRGETFEYAESPLTMNIITPANPKGCPVLLYIHGGGFFNGKMSEHPMGTSFEYAKRGVILVSVGYRLNVFGLFRSRNYYLYDQICAIKWVRDNIEAFGGNAGDITLIGQSAGAMSIFQLLYTDTLKGIVKGAVMMSGAGFFPSLVSGYTEKEGKYFWDAVMKKAGCRNDEELKKVDTETLWRAWFEAKSENSSLQLLMPGIDGKLIYDRPSRIKRKGNMLDIPVLVGTTSQDMLFSAAMFKMMTGFATWSCRKKRQPVYTYYFDKVPPGNLYKAYHACDLWYVFGNMDKCWRPWEEADYKLRDTMIEAVCKFVKTGNPGWDAFTPKNRKIRRFNVGKGDFVRPLSRYPELIKYSIFERGPF